VGLLRSQSAFGRGRGCTVRIHVHAGARPVATGRRHRCLDRRGCAPGGVLRATRPRSRWRHPVAGLAAVGRVPMGGARAGTLTRAVRRLPVGAIGICHRGLAGGGVLQGRRDGRRQRRARPREQPSVVGGAQPGEAAPLFQGQPGTRRRGEPRGARRRSRSRSRWVARLAVGQPERAHRGRPRSGQRPAGRAPRLLAGASQRAGSAHRI
jgi:hypothetical protein